MNEYLKSFVIGSSWFAFIIFFYAVYSYEQQNIINYKFDEYTFKAPIVLGLIAIGLIFWFRKEQQQHNEWFYGETEASEHGYRALMEDFTNYQVKCDRELSKLSCPRKSIPLFKPSLTQSLKDACDYYLLALAARKIRGLGDDHCCMMIHVSRSKIMHEKFGYVSGGSYIYGVEIEVI